MLPFVTKLVASATFIALVSTLAARHPQFAGYLTAIPLTAILVLSFTYLQTSDSSLVTRYAVSILAAIPASAMFFVPFLLQSRLRTSFWMTLGLGLLCYYLGFFVQQALLARFIR